MDGWTYQGIELRPNERSMELFARLCRLEEALGLSVLFQAVGTFRAPMSKADPPRYNPKGQPRRFLHVIWQRDSAQAWPILLHVAERDRRSLLSSYTGTGFLAKDIDFRDGHPRESILLAAFNSDAEDFLDPLKPSSTDEFRRAIDWQDSVEREVVTPRRNGTSSRQLDMAARLAEAHRVRFEHGWYLSSGLWRSRYLVQTEDGFMALAAAQESLCTCTSRHPEALQLMMPSDECVHHLAARLVDCIAERALEPGDQR